LTAHSKTAILDSGCTSHFITNNSPYNITKENKPQLTVRMPNNETILSYNTAKLHLPTLNAQARKSHVFKGLNNNLLYVGQLCDAGYNVNLEATVHEKSNIIITAKRDHSNGLWRAPLTDHMHKHNNVQRKRSDHLYLCAKLGGREVKLLVCKEGERGRSNKFQLQIIKIAKPSILKICTGFF
jgi:hypothetical protein